MDEQMLQARQSFIDEARELLHTMESLLLQAEEGQCDAEAINAMFRSAHTIKGSAGLFGLEVIVGFTHTLENVLEQARAGKLVLEAGLASLLLNCTDHLAELVELASQLGQSEGDITPEASVLGAGAALQTQLNQHMGTKAAAGPAAAPLPVHTQIEAEKIPADTGGSDNWHISLRFGQDVFRHGMDPLCFIAYLSELGDIKQTTTLAEAMPGAELMDPESCYLGFEIDLASQASKESIESVFDFVREDCAIRIIPPHSALQEYIQLIGDLPEDAARIGEILIRGGALTERELQLALDAQAQQFDARQPIGEILVNEGLAAPELVHAALEKQKTSANKRLTETKYLKVAAERLDVLINLVGELVIAGATTASLATRNGNAALLESTNILSRLVEEIRDSALRMRMVPIGETFSRFPRVVRDVSRELSKEIELQISGGETELDKSMVEHIGDPLMHLVRNAIDHGIEPASTRQAAGKPTTGTLRLNAFHDSGSVVLEVKDDGGGLNRARIRNKAIEKGLITEEQVLADRDLLRLIFEPGFSTAAEVTNLSGRGVGMDVVKRNIDAMRGSIEIDSTEGQGTTIRLRLPLTLAIIDGFVISVAQSYFIIPLDMVMECLELKGVAENAHYVNLRGEVLPFVRLRELFELEGAPSRHENVVVVRCGELKAGIVVDVLHGEAQTVIKPLPSLFKKLRGIGGSTILGSGEVALILDVMALIELAVSAENQKHVEYKTN